MLPDLRIGKGKILVNGGREWLILLLSLLLAFFIWSIHNLSLTYSTFFDYSVQITSDLSDRPQYSLSEETLMLRGKAPGFYILKNRIGKKDLISFNLSSKYLKRLPGTKDIFFARSANIRDAVNQFLSNEVEVEYFVTDTLFFHFPKINTKKVPVCPKSSLSYKSQYMMVGGISLKPDSVILYGEAKYLENIDSVFTETISRKQLHSPTQGVVRIVRDKELSLSEEEVFYSFDVERYFEASIEVPLIVRNLPSDKNLLTMPSSITVTYRQSFDSNSVLLPDDFTYVIDYHDFVRSIDSKLIPKPIKVPDFLYYLTFDPPYVECVQLSI